MEVLAGAIAGFVMGALSLGPTAMVAPDVVRAYPALRRSIQTSASLMLTSMVAVFLLSAVWTLLGTLLGLVYRWALQGFPGEGLLSPNAFFSLAMLLAAPAFPLAIALVLRRWSWPGAIVGVLFAGVFGWLLPYLAK
ncbi:MAG: hypothetical protein HY684_03275 [Chloroflexi bacterium]|nr:hypothetical protein [Chloroflexota bacterium]